MWSVSLESSGRVRGSSDGKGKEGACRELLVVGRLVLIHMVANSCVRHNSKSVLKGVSKFVSAIKMS
jgi:hypothetical protein